jgi:Arm DNA-binding domain
MLSNPECENVRPKPSVHRLKDSQNLFLVVYPSGRKSWEYRYQDKGKSKALIIGEYGDRKPALGLKAARAERDAISADRNKGADPVTAAKLEGERQRAQLEAAKSARAERAAEKARARLTAERGAVTVQTVAEGWIAANSPHWSKGHAHQCVQSLEDFVYPKIGAKHPEAVEPSHILDLVSGMLADGTIETARRVRQRMDAIFEHGGLYYGFKGNPVALAKRELSKRIKVAKRASPEEHFPSVPPKEIPQLLRAMRAYVGTPVTRSLLWGGTRGCLERIRFGSRHLGHSGRAHERAPAASRLLGTDNDSDSQGIEAAYSRPSVGFSSSVPERQAGERERGAVCAGGNRLQGAAFWPRIPQYVLYAGE